MENLEMIFGKKVLALRQAEGVGYILNICFDNDLNKLKGFIVIDEESENELFLPLQKVLSFNGECVIIEDVSDCELSLEEEVNPLGKIVYDSKGVNLGVVERVEIKNKKIDKLITNKCEIKQKYISNFGKEFIIFSLKKQKKLKNNIKNEKIIKIPKIEIMREENLITDKSPSKLAINVAMLLNRISTADIYGMNNELLIKKGEIINQNYINKVKKHNKLNYLFFNSK